ncbi:MAG TPA: right-handed parallel beta-helix repeat-containing protein [Bryobacteraceae bacterium]|nr:right-handed parallel beta-helix repeat-containing protein [Bryobacteraceae bacterium]
MRIPRNAAAGLTLAALSLMALGTATQSASAQTCGSNITQSTVLRTNIGPCSGNGLIIPAGVKNITLDLNGFTISGTRAAGSIGVDNQGVMVIIKGAGAISNFETGVRMLQQASNVAQRATIENLRLVSNRIGIDIVGICCPNPEGANRILRNRIESGEIGIRLVGTEHDRIAENRISNQTAYGMAVYQGHVTLVELNVVRENGIGIYLDGYTGTSTVRHNDVSANRQDGIASLPDRITIEGNILNRNGRDGLICAAQWPGASETVNLIVNNIALENGRRGIGLGDYDGHTAGGVNLVTGNLARANGVADLFWDQTGPSNCWSGNNFGKSVPASLPLCQ